MTISANRILPDETAPLPNMSVATLRERCAVGPVAFSGSGVVLSGYVTTSDRADNFYRTLMLEDNSARSRSAPDCTICTTIIRSVAG